jgi:CHAD domain-containing protein
VNRLRQLGDAGALPRSYDHSPVAVSESPNGSRTFDATYHDTEDRRLASAGAVLRRRMENGKNVWELEVGDATRAADGGPSGPPEEILRVLAAALRGRELLEVAKTRTHSEGDDVKTTVFEGQRVITVVPDWQPKLPKPLPMRQPKKSAPALERLRSYLQEQVDELRRHDPGVRLGEDDERIHRMRVATRRARSALRTARAFVDRQWADELRGELKWLGGELSAARDLDVLLAGLEGEAVDVGKSATPIIRQLEGDRRRAHKRLVRALDSPRYLALLDELERSADAPRVRKADANLDKLARDDFKKLRRAVRRLGKKPSDEQLHDVRKRGKRARYSAELAGGKRMQKLISAAKSFQDVVGEHQDAVVAETQLTGMVPRLKSPDSVFAAGRLLERQTVRRRAARKAFPRAWRKLDRQGRRAWA